MNTEKQTLTLYPWTQGRVFTSGKTTSWRRQGKLSTTTYSVPTNSALPSLLKSKSIFFLKHNHAHPSIDTGPLCQLPAQTQHLQAIGTHPGSSVCLLLNTSQLQNVCQTIITVGRILTCMRFTCSKCIPFLKPAFREPFLSHEPNKRFRSHLLSSDGRRNW